MPRFIVTYSYPTVDRYYRGQRTTAVEAESSLSARLAVLESAPQGSRIVRVKLRG